MSVNPISISCAACHSTFAMPDDIEPWMAAYPHMLGREGQLRVCNINFCSPLCAIEYFERHPEAMSGWISADEAFCSERRLYWNCGCHFCKKDEPDARYLTAGAPFQSTFDDENPSHLCSVTCLREALMRELENFLKRKRTKWYSHSSAA